VASKTLAAGTKTGAGFQDLLRSGAGLRHLSVGDKHRSCNCRASDGFRELATTNQ